MRRAVCRLGRARVTAVIFILALSCVSTASAFHAYTTYAGYQTYSPEEGNGSAYDAACDRWNQNRMEKNGSGNNGTLAWIDSSGGWQASVRTTEWVMDYGLADYAWKKKLYGKNSSVVTYTATLKGHGDLAEPGCV
jgi:hypothetical protein